MDDTLHGSLRKMKNDADSQTRRLTDDTPAGKRTMRDLAVTEWFGRRIREARPNLGAIRKEVEKLEKEPGATDRTTEKPE